ncbi:MAG: calcium-binding protein [Pirellulales bacterium]
MPTRSMPCAWTSTGILIVGYDGNDILKGGAGDDDIRGGNDDDTLEGNGGSDRLDWNDSGSSLGNDILRGGLGNDFLLGNVGNDQLEGGDGDDQLMGGIGEDTYVFDTDSALGQDTLTEDGTDVDTLDFSKTTTKGVIVDLSLSTVQSINVNLNILLNSSTLFENVVGGSQADQLTGNSLNNQFAGGSGNDVYYFDADTAQGSDSIVESAVGGTDSLNFSKTTTLGIAVDLASVATQIVNSNLNLSLSSTSVIENVIGSTRSDFIQGNALSNSLNGGAGDDSIYGQEGDDTLVGASGADTLAGGLGNDRYLFDADTQLGSDTIVELPNQNIDTLDFGATTTRSITLNLSQDTIQIVNPNLSVTLSSSANIENIIGGSLSDFLVGNAGSNTLQGGPGSDTLAGLAGDDILRGNDGDDNYLFDVDSSLGSDTVQDVEGGIDTLDFSASTSQAISIALGRTTSQVVAPNLSLVLGSAIQIENVIGTSLDDQIEGSATSNRLSGGNGNDTYLFDSDTSQGSDIVVELTNGGADSLSFESTTSQPISLNLGIITSQVVNSNLTLTLSSSSTFENVIGGARADVLVGNTLNNTLDGRSGDDELNGASGNDTLLGGQGLDTLIGAQGNDTLKGGPGNDTYTFRADSQMGSDSLEELLGEGNDRINFASTQTRSVSLDLALTTVQIGNPLLSLTLNASDAF